MKIIIFAGGTGKRFWPASRKIAPKQFLPVTDNKPLLRHRVDLLLTGFSKEDIFISTGKQYENEVRQMLPELPLENFILEPEMRDTGPAVTLAVTYVANLFKNEVISIQWSDHLIKKQDVFIRSLKESEEIVKNKNKIVFITVPARFPSPHRGYIKFNNRLESIGEGIALLEFEKFVEKPIIDVAKTYVKSGQYGWNPGYWITTAQNYLDIVSKKNFNYVEVCKKMVDDGLDSSTAKLFSTLEKISADYLFAENVDSNEAVVLMVEMGWSDVGEWISLKEALEESPDSNVIKGNVKDLDSKDSIIYNYEDSKLISTIGLNGFVVVNTKDVIAIFKKDDNVRLKEYLKNLEDQGFTSVL